MLNINLFCRICPEIFLIFIPCSRVNFICPWFCRWARKIKEKKHERKKTELWKNIYWPFVILLFAQYKRIGFVHPRVNKMAIQECYYLLIDFWVRGQKTRLRLLPPNKIHSCLFYQDFFPSIFDRIFSPFKSNKTW